MRNKRLLIALVGAIIFGLIGALSISRFLKAQASATTLNAVVVARVEIPLGSMITAEQLTTAQFARGSTPEGVFQSVAELVGRVAITSIAPREPVTSHKLAPIGAAAGLSSMIPSGYRAMTVKVDDVMGISGFVMPGAIVDIVVVIDPPDNSTSKDAISKIVLQNIKVLASGQNIDRPKDDREAESVKTVTVQVTPEQTEKLALASTEGKLRLVMRNAGDQNDEQTPGANRKSLLSGERVMLLPEPSHAVMPAPAPSAPRRPRLTAPRQRMVAPVQVAAPAPRRYVEVIEGSKKRQVDFP